MNPEHAEIFVDGLYAQSVAPDCLKFFKDTKTKWEETGLPYIILVLVEKASIHKLAWRHKKLCIALADLCDQVPECQVTNFDPSNTCCCVFQVPVVGGFKFCVRLSSVVPQAIAGCTNVFLTKHSAPK